MEVSKKRYEKDAKDTTAIHHELRIAKWLAEDVKRTHCLGISLLDIESEYRWGGWRDY